MGEDCHGNSVSEPVRIPGQIPSVMDYIRNDFGVMSGAESFEVCLKFTPQVAEWVSEQIWHSYFWTSRLVKSMVGVILRLRNPSRPQKLCTH